MNQINTQFLSDTDKLMRVIAQTLSSFADIVGKTLGPGGLPILIQRFGRDTANRPIRPLITKDGVTVARAIHYKDGLKNSIIQSVLETAERTNEEAGDGTTTAVVLANAIFEAGMSYLINDESLNAQDMLRSVERAFEDVLKELEKYVEKITEVDQIKSIATISANGESEIGEVVARAFEEVGEEGVITLEEGYGQTTTLDIEQGFRIEKGLLHPEAFYSDKGKGLCILNNCAIILFDGEIDSETDIIPILSKITEEWTNRNAFLIIARDIIGAAQNTLCVNRIENRITNFAMIKGPHVGHIRTAMMEDIAVATGGKLLLKDANGGNSNLRDAELSDLGFAKKIVISIKETLIYDGAGEESEVFQKIEELKESKARAYSPYDAMIIDQRIASLSGGIAVIRVGGKTELEMKEKKDRIEDALNATRAAIQEGIIPGGGFPLWDISKVIGLKDEIGYKVLAKAIQKPVRTIISNIGMNPDIVLKDVDIDRGAFSQAPIFNDEGYSVEVSTSRIGFDAASRKIVDLFDQRVIDPVKVTKSALKNAVSIANLLLTCGGAITIDGELKMETPITNLGEE